MIVLKLLLVGKQSSLDQGIKRRVMHEIQGRDRREQGKCDRF